MARLSFTGLEEFSDKISALGAGAEGMARMALYDGAGVVADALRESVMSLPLTGRSGKPYEGLLPDDREDLANGIGIAKFETRGGSVTTSLGFNGYARRTERKYPKGVPLAMLARSLESGSSVRAKHPFVRSTVRRVKTAVQEAMAKRVQDTIKDTLEG